MLMAFLRDLDAVVALVEDEGNDLFADLPHAPGYTLLREALLVADHNAYHLGQIVVLRRALGLWKDAEGMTEVRPRSIPRFFRSPRTSQPGA
jgi:hypothetical protein